MVKTLKKYHKNCKIYVFNELHEFEVFMFCLSPKLYEMANFIGYFFVSCTIHISFIAIVIRT